MEVTALLIKERLLGNLERTLTHLLPNGHVIGHEFRVGSVNGEAGKSLAVELRGARKGLWADYAHPKNSGNSGDIISLWCAVRGKKFKEGFEEMKSFCGFRNVEGVRKEPKPVPGREGISRLTSECHEYLAGRGFNDHTITKYRLRSHARRVDMRDPSSETRRDFILFPYIDSEGDPVMIKSTRIHPQADGKKNIWTSRPYYTLFGWWMVDDDAREIIITEGEYDALALFQMGVPFPVLSLPTGTNNMDWITNDWSALQRFERIYLAFDNDPIHPKTGLRPGEEAAREAARRLGPARCLRVPIPADLKDANSVLLEGDERLIDWTNAWLPKAYTYDPPTISGVGEFREEAHARLARQKKLRGENTFLWPSIPFQFRNGESTVVSGYPHGGKSAWIYQTHAHEMFIEERVYICSFEIDPEDMIVQLATILLGAEPDDPELDRMIDWMHGRLYFFRRNKREKTGLVEVLADLDYAVQRYGCTRIVIDSLHFIARKEDYEGQDNVSLQFTNFAKSRNVHVAFVCHSVVKKGEEIIPGLGMVEGSGGITKPIDNGVTIWRNNKKQEAILKAEEEENETKLEQAKKMHDGVMKFWKNRESGKLPMVKLWFNPDTKSYRLKRDGSENAPLAPPKTDDPNTGVLF